MQNACMCIAYIILYVHVPVYIIFICMYVCTVHVRITSSLSYSATVEKDLMDSNLVCSTPFYHANYEW